MTTTYQVLDAADVAELVKSTGVREVTLLPSAARALLDLNTVNRHLKRTWLRQLVRVLETDQWHLTPDAVSVTRDGDLLNGQHRLQAAVEADKPIRVLLQTGAEPAARAATDVGARRQLADLFQLSGHPHAVATAATAKLHYRYLRNVGNPWRAARTGGQPSNIPTYEDSYRYAVETHPAILGVQTDARNLYEALPGVRLVVWATALALLDELTSSRAEVDRFVEALVTGADLGRGDPRLALRNYAVRLRGLRSRNLRRGHEGAMEPAERQLATVVKAWNLWLDGEEIRVLTFRERELLELPR